MQYRHVLRTVCRQTALEKVNRLFNCNNSDISQNSAKILLLLDIAGPLWPNRIEFAVSLSKKSTNMNIHQMVAHGLIERIEYPQKPVTRYQISQKGKMYLNEYERRLRYARTPFRWDQVTKSNSAKMVKKPK